jgi:hypothetical protein
MGRQVELFFDGFRPFDVNCLGPAVVAKAFAKVFNQRFG